MGVLDTLEEVGSSIVDTASSLPSAAAGAVSFAGEVAGRAAGMVGDLTGLSGLPDRIRETVQTARETVNGAVDTVLDAAANPRRTIQAAADRAFSGASKAVQGAQSIANRILDGAGSLSGKIADGVSSLASHITSSVASHITNTVERVGAMVTGGAGLARDLVTRALGGALDFGNRAIDWGGALAQQGISIASGVLQNVAHGIADHVAQGVRNLTGKLTRMASNLATGVSRVAQGTANIVGRVADSYGRGISRIATNIGAMVQNVAGAIAPHLPGPLGNLVTAGAGVVGNVAAGVSTFATNAAGRVREEAQGVAIFVATRSGEAQAFVTAELASIREELTTRVVNAGDLVAGGIDLIGQRMHEKVQERMTRLHARVGSIHSAIQAKVNRANELIQQTVPTITQAVTTATHNVQSHLDQRLQAGVGFVRDRVSEAVEGGKRIVGGVGKMAGRAIGFGERIVDRAIDIGGSVVGRATDFGASTFNKVENLVQKGLDSATSFTMSARPNDGDLTGPFLPGEPMVEPEQVGALHGRSNPTAREGMISSGSSLFINGIDTSLAEHYRAAQRLANELGTPVVGVYNATAGMGADLLQCAADKMFDRSGNPAVRTLTRLITTYGDARQPRGGLNIFAHSQGSLILSEALRQASKTGADLSRNDVTTFGNAAFTYPAGPTYHHYIHDDDAVSSSVGSGSGISYMMNQTSLGRMFSNWAMGPTSDAQANTTYLHHGGSMIAPHAINAPDKHDYIGDLSAFRAAEASRRSAGTAGASAAQEYRRTEGASSFAVVRGAASMVAGATERTYGALDTKMRALPSVPFLPPNTIWGGISSGLRSIGTAVSSAASAYAASRDYQYAGAMAGAGAGSMAGAAASGSYIQRQGDGAQPAAAAGEVKAKLDQQASFGFTVDTQMQKKLSGIFDADLSGMKFHVDPAAAEMARSMNAEAFTIGQDVYFSAGSYSPNTDYGLSLIAHEATHVVQQSSPGDAPRFLTQSGGDQMEQEAQRTGQMVLANPQIGNDLKVERIETTYDSNDGITAEDQARLDSIMSQALEIASQTLGKQAGVIEVVDVSAEIDLVRHSDSMSARLVAVKIIDRVNRAPRAALTRRPSVARLQRAPVGAPDGPAQPRPKPPEIDPGMLMLMKWDTESTVAVLRDDPDLGDAIKIAQFVFERIAAYEKLDKDYEQATGYRGTTYKNKFLWTLFNRTFPVDEWFADRWTNTYDEMYNIANGMFAKMMKAAAADTKDFGDGRTMEEPESVWSYVGKREAYAGLTVVKHLSTGLSSVADAGIWVGEKISGNKLDFRLADYVGKSFDENIIGPAAGAMGIDPNEKLIGNMSLKNVSDIGGKVVSGLTMAGALTPGAGASGAVKTGAAVIGAVQAGMSAEQLYDTVKDLRKKGMSWGDIVSRPDIWVQTVSVVAGAIGAGSGFASQGSQLAKTLEALGIAANGVQMATLGAAIYATEQDDTISDEEKAERESDFLSTLVLTGALTINQKYGEKFQEAWQRKANQETGKPPPAEQRQLPPGQPEPTVPPTEQNHQAPPADHPQQPAPTEPNHPVVDVPVPVPVAEPAVPVQEPVAQAPAKKKANAKQEKSTTQRPDESPAQRRRRVATEEAAKKQAAAEAEGAPKDEHAAQEKEKYNATKRHLEAVNSGNEAAAEQLIKSVKSFKKLREMSVAHGDEPPLLSPEGVKAVNAVRNKLQAGIKKQVLAKFPDMEFVAPGTTGFASDTDVTVRPKDYNKLTDPQQIADAVRRSGQAVEEANKAARKLGAEPDETLDTNYYSYTGADSPVQGGANPSRPTRNAMTVASLAEQHQAMSPEAWAKYRETMISQAASSQGANGPEAAKLEHAAQDQLRVQLDQAEAMSNQLKNQRELIAARLKKENPTMTDAGSQMRAREQLARIYRQKLVNALGKAPVNFAEVAMLQSQIKMIEPGAYASAAGIADVPYYQQQVGDKAVLDPDYQRRPVQDRNTNAEVVMPDGGVLDSGEGARRYMEQNPVTGLRNLADSAGSTFAQLEAHASHPPSSPAEALDLIKQVFKYTNRIEHAAEATRSTNHNDPIESLRGMSREEQPLGVLDSLSGGTVEQIGGIPRDQIIKMLGQEGAVRDQALAALGAEAKARGLGSIEQMAQTFANKERQWAMEMTAAMRAKAAINEAAQIDSNDPASVR